MWAFWAAEPDGKKPPNPKPTEGCRGLGCRTFGREGRYSGLRA